jgi:regulator of RNase E activity RraA
LVEGDHATASDVSDACDELGLAAARSGGLRPVWDGAPAISGVLRTVRLEPADSSPVDELLALLAEKASVLWLVDLEGRLDHQCWGSRLATAAQRYGVPGVLVNGAVRDVDEPVGLDGVTVAAGSYVVADSSGLVAFEAARAGEVLDLALEIRRRER